MRRVRGLGGHAFLVADKLPFVAEPLEDAGDGFDWRLCDRLRVWCDDEPITFEVRPPSGEWAPIAPLAVYHLTTRVAFTRCLRGQQVRASGVCRPIAEVVTSEEWDLRVEVPFVDTTTLEDDSRRLESKEDARTASAVLERCVVGPFASIDGVPLLVRLPRGAGVLTGVGVRTMSPDTSDVHVMFDEGRVSYVPC